MTENAENCNELLDRIEKLRRLIQRIDQRLLGTDFKNDCEALERSAISSPTNSYSLGPFSVFQALRLDAERAANRGLLFQFINGEDMASNLFHHVQSISEAISDFRVRILMIPPPDTYR
jgi:hypothetical protein